MGRFPRKKPSVSVKIRKQKKYWKNDENHPIPELLKIMTIVLCFMLQFNRTKFEFLFPIVSRRKIKPIEIFTIN